MLVVVAEKRLCTTTTSGACGQLRFRFRLGVALQTGCGGVRKQNRFPFVAMPETPPYFKGKSVFCLYVSVGVLIPLQDCNRGRLLFGVATFLCVCFGVGYGFFFTRHTWLHVELVAVWMWRHVSSVFFSTRINEQEATLMIAAPRIKTEFWRPVANSADINFNLFLD